MGEGENEKNFLRSTPPLSFLLPIIHPLGKTFFLSQVSHGMKNSRWRLNFLRCERSLEKISPALQANRRMANISFQKFLYFATLIYTEPESQLAECQYFNLFFAHTDAGNIIRREIDFTSSFAMLL